VVFTSDNGPWLTFNTHGGSAGLLSGGKGGTYEGGMRVPAIFWWPGKIKPGVVMDIGMTLDLLPTFCKLANVTVPNDRIYDGYDISPVIFGTGPDPRDVVFYYRDVDIFAVRKGAYKAHFFTQSEYGPDARKEHNPPLLFDLNVDPSEKHNIADKHPEVIEEIIKVMNQHRSTLKPVENQLEK
jgi:arylsulfatase A